MNVRLPKPPAVNPGYRLGMSSKRSRYAEYTWNQAVKMSGREGNSENALRVELQVLRWAGDGSQIDPLYFSARELAKAKAAAKAHVSAGGSMAEVRGISSRVFSQPGFGDKAVWDLMTVDRGA